MTLILADHAHPRRAELERVVRDVFRTEYGAHVPAFPSRLVASLDEEGKPLAVAGLRFAEDGLFSEVYLDQPVEQAIAAAVGRPVDRGAIVEFSSMAAARGGAALPMVAAAIRLCLAAGASYGLFTATSRLRALLRRAGLVTVDLGPAMPERLADAATWGSYYLHDPRVLAVSADTLASLRPLNPLGASAAPPGASAAPPGASAAPPGASAAPLAASAAPLAAPAAPLAASAAPLAQVCHA